MKRKDIELESKILDTASTLFMEHDYKNVDMRKIANESGCAVGTIYNYFPSKEGLYIQIFSKSWEKTIKKIDVILSSDEDTVTKVTDFLIQLYKGKEERKYLSKEIINKSIKETEDNITEKLQELWEEQICGRLKQIIMANEQNSEDLIWEKHLDQLINAMVFSVMSLKSTKNDNEETALEFIKIFTCKLMKQ